MRTGFRCSYRYQFKDRREIKVPHRYSRLFLERTATSQGQKAQPSEFSIVPCSLSVRLNRDVPDVRAELEQSGPTNCNQVPWLTTSYIAHAAISLALRGSSAMDTPFAAKGSPTNPRNRPKPMGLAQTMRLLSASQVAGSR